MQIQGFPANIKIAGHAIADNGSVVEALLQDIVCFVYASENSMSSC
jgi:hypothetical protein